MSIEKEYGEMVSAILKAQPMSKASVRDTIDNSEKSEVNIQKVGGEVCVKESD